MTNAFKYFQSNNKIQSWESYPYAGNVGTCKQQASQGIVGVSSHVTLKSGDIAAHMNAVAKTPVTIAIASSSASFAFYKTGILDTTACGTSINHAVTLVGYGKD